MNTYLKKAMEQYFKDNNIQYSGLEVNDDGVKIKKLDINISFKQMREFESGFRLQPISSWDYDEISINDIEFFWI